MCGILGACLKAGQTPARRELEGALETLAHRGPDGRGVYVAENVGLGHTRLAIIDLAGGDQPMANADSSLWLSFNGEIYNYVELREELGKKGHNFRTTSDTEVILHLYEDYGFDCLQHLRGMFAFALWDAREKLLFVARDRLGVKPLVYAQDGAGFYFASEIQSLFKLNRSLGKDPDLAALDCYLALQYIPSPRTGFAQVRKLPPAHYLVVRDGRAETPKPYWRIRYEPGGLSFSQACERLRELFLEATRIRMRSDVPYGAFLSGGADSSIVVAAMSRLIAEPPRTFSVGFGVAGYDELDRARQVAEQYGTRHQEFHVNPEATTVLPLIVRALGEPLGDSSIIPTYYISQATSAHVKVVLTGDGGDETFAGYKRLYQLSFLDWLERSRLLSLWAWLRRGTVALEGALNPRRRGRAFPYTKMDRVIASARPARYLAFLELFREEERRSLYTPLMLDQAGDPGGYLTNRIDEAEGLNGYLFAEQTTFLPEDILVKVDICSMLNALECRSPLLDHRLIEFAATLPGSFKLDLRHKLGKRVLKDTFRSWFPPGFLEQKKVGFAAPTPLWMAGPLKDWAQGEITGSRPLAKLLNLAKIQELFQDSRANHRKLWSLAVLATWFKVFGIEL